MKQSWKTSAAGIGAVLVALGQVFTAIGHSDVSEAASALPALIAGLGLLFARDNDKSSEDVGAGK